MTRAHLGIYGATLVVMAFATSGNVGARSAPMPRQDAAAPSVPEAVVPPDDYVIGAEDVLIVQFWRDDQMSSDAVVRPDGKITLRLLNDVQAAGLTPDQLRVSLTAAATKYLEDPSVTVGVKQINSRKVTVLGEVAKQGPLPLNSPTTVLAAIGMAGGFSEYAKKDRILIIRTEGGKQVAHRFNYEEVSEGRRLEQNIFLKPGDTVMVK